MVLSCKRGDNGKQYEMMRFGQLERFFGNFHKKFGEKIFISRVSTGGQKLKKWGKFNKSGSAGKCLMYN